jgi:hypothetical protein
MVVLIWHIDAEHAPALRVGRRGATALHAPQPHTREGTTPAPDGSTGRNGGARYGVLYQ